MKRLMILAVVVILTTTSSGCRRCRWWNNGDQCGVPCEVYCPSPCMSSPCDSCAPGGMPAAPMLPQTYLPGPT